MTPYLTSLRSKRFFLFLIVFFFSFELSAETPLKGKVTDEKGKGLPFALVYIPELEKGTVTDDNGFFWFDNLGKGTIRLQCSHIGYSTVVKTVDLSQQATEIVIQL